MPPPSTTSPVTGETVPPHYIHSSSAFFRDTKGRHLLLRGVNLSGSAKAPLSQPSQEDSERFWSLAESGGESFVGQPLRLDDGSADVHLARLRGWGFGVLRYVVCWEALERQGPGIYDYEFMDYTIEVLRKCKEYGFKVYMDPHQDIWSRFSGGSGAPYWTLPACGFEPRNFSATQAAYLHNEYPDPKKPDPSSYPAMIWSTNYQRTVSQTIFTLFYGGRDFAPLCIIDGVNIQDWLQSHFNAAFVELAKKIREAGDLLDECIIGWDSMNEPGEGLIGYDDIGVIPKTQALKKGPSPTAFEGLRLGMGEAVTVENWVFSAMGPARDGSVTVDPKGKKCWMDPSKETNGSKWGWKRDPGWQLGTCIWALHGVWEPSTSTLLKPHYFQTSPANPTRPISFVPDYWRPAWELWARGIRKEHPECIHFIQPPVFHPPPELDEEDLRGRACVSCHFYDGLTLLTRHWNWFNADALGILRGKYSTILQGIRVGERAIRNVIQEQLGILQQDTFDMLGQYPTLIGEIGIPYDMDAKKAYGYAPDGKGKGDYSAQQRALDASLNASDGPNMLNWTVWTYCVDNSHKWGDGWNLEDLSLWSPDDTKTKLAQASNRLGSSDSTRHLQPSSGLTSLAPSPTRSPVISSSSPSAATLADPSALSSQPDKSSSPSYTILPPQSPYTLPRDILTDGARAVGAFSRPYPTATVGVPTRIDFDIKSSVFKMTVEVYPGEVIEEGVATEIFLPWVHYASDKGFGEDVREDGGMAKKLSAEARATNVSDSNLTSATSSISAPGPPVTSILGPHSSSLSPSQIAPARLPSFDLSVEVDVSAGRFELSGQTLKWYYPASSAAPAASREEESVGGTMPGGFASNSSRGKEGRTIYEIKVKRRGGPLRETVESGGGGGGGLWETCGLNKLFG